MLRNRVKRVNRVLLTIGVGAAVCAFPVALAAARAPGDPRASVEATTAQARVVLAAGTAARQATAAKDAVAAPAAGADPAGAASAAAQPGVRAAPQILFPIPSQGPPRQFPLGPSPSPTPPPTTPPPPTPTPTPARPKPAAKPAPKPVVVKPAPKPAPKPPPKPAPKPAPTPPQPPLPPTHYHAVPRRRLTPVLVVFLVAIVPVSLARVRR